LTASDLCCLIEHLTVITTENQSRLPQNELNAVVGHILDEAGMEGNRSINESEFQQLIQKLPDFVTSFKFFL